MRGQAANDTPGVRDPGNHRKWLDAARDAGGRIAAGFAVVATLAIAFNAVVYAASSANPFLVTDWWYYVKSFLIPHEKSGLTIASLLSKRFELDHALPLQKLILLADAKWFGLNLRAVTLAGLFVALSTMLLFAGWVLRDRASGKAGWHWLAVLVITSAYLSMNKLTVFTAPLMSMYYVTLLVAWLAVAAVAHGVATGHNWIVLLAMFLCAVCNDDVGILVFASGIALVLFSGMRHHIDRRRLVGLLAAMSIGFALARGLYLVYGSIDGSYSVLAPSGGAGSRISALLDLGFAGWMRGIAVVLSGGVLHRSYFPPSSEMAMAWRMAIAILGAAMHLWFWHAQWRMRPTFLGRVALAMMLFWYLVVAGIWYGRIPDFGLATLDSARYTFFFGLAFLPLVFQACAGMSGEGSKGDEAASRAVLLCCALLVVAPQPLFIEKAWRISPILAKSDREIARQIGLVEKAGRAPDCIPQLMALCRRSHDERDEVFRYLRSHRYNVYSPRIRQMYALPESSQDDATH